MWESLGSGPRQDRLLHGAAKAFSLALGLVMLPIWLGGRRLASPLRRLLGVLDREPQPLPVAPSGNPGMGALLAELQRIPNGGLHPSRSATLRKGLADISMFIL